MTPASTTTATWLTIGLAIKNDSVTPSGMPASTKPMNSGIDEHEQNGVTAPRPTAIRRAPGPERPRIIARTFSGVSSARSQPIR